MMRDVCPSCGRYRDEDSLFCSAPHQRTRPKTTLEKLLTESTRPGGPLGEDPVFVKVDRQDAP